MSSEHQARSWPSKTAYIRTALAVVRIANRAAQERATAEPAPRSLRTGVTPARLKVVGER